MTKFIALFKKDLLLELRQQYTFYGIVLYVASTIFVLYLAMGNPEPFVWNGLFWMIQLFVCVNAVAKSFLQEGRGRLLYFYSIAGARDFILAKLLFNALLMMAMSVISLLLFMLLLGNPVIHPLRFVGMAVMGGMGLSIIFTFLSAIAARAGQGAALMAILGFPLVIPQVLLIMRLTNTVFSDVFLAASSQIVLMLLALDALIIVLCMILFPFLWKD
jgi:heme exporter protein B